MARSRSGSRSVSFESLSLTPSAALAVAHANPTLAVMPRPAVKDRGFGADTPTALLDVADTRSFHGWYDVQ